MTYISYKSSYTSFLYFWCLTNTSPVDLYDEYLSIRYPAAPNGNRQLADATSHEVFDTVNYVIISTFACAVTLGIDSCDSA